MSLQISNIASMDKKDNNKIKENTGYNRYIKIILLIIFAFLLILFFGILIGKKFFGSRKLKVNELLELYDYRASSKSN